MEVQRYPEPTVGALIFNSRDELLLIKSHKWKNKYVVPGGHIELGERTEVALVREVKEETNLDIYDIQFLCYQDFIYDEAFWKPRHFIFMDFTCRTEASDVKLNDEAQEYIWVTIEEAVRLPMDPFTLHAIELARSRI